MHNPGLRLWMGDRIALKAREDSYAPENGLESGERDPISEAFFFLNDSFFYRK